MKENMKVLVMGGTQFVSRAMAQHLIKRGYVVDIFTRGILDCEYSGIRNHLIGDRNLVEDLNRELNGKKYDYIFDISAYTKEQGEKLINVIDRENLKRYVLCSSGGVYLSSPEVLKEDAERGRTIWGQYGVDKLELEDHLFDLGEKEDFPYTIFRPTYIYGEGNNLSRETYFFSKIINGEDIPIPYGDEQTQFLHIDDFVQTLEGCLKVEKSRKNVYNLTAESTFNWDEYLQELFTAVEKKSRVIKITKEEEKRLEIVISRQYFPFRNETYLLDITKLKEDGLHVPEIDLGQGLKRAYKWYLDNPHELGDQRMIDNVHKLFMN